MFLSPDAICQVINHQSSSSEEIFKDIEAHTISKD
jgi:hypothetical protein